ASGAREVHPDQAVRPRSCGNSTLLQRGLHLRNGEQNKRYQGRIKKFSAIGRIARAGRKLSAPTSSAVPVSNTPNVIPSEGITPRLGGRREAAAKRPAKASANTAKT